MLRFTSRLLTLIPLAWALIIVDVLCANLFFAPTLYQVLHSIPFAILLAVVGLVLLTFCCRYLLDYTQWRRVQVQRSRSHHFDVYAAYAWCALQRRHRRWPRIPISEQLSFDREERSFRKTYWLVFSVSVWINAWVHLGKWSVLGLVLLQVATTAGWLLMQRYTPRLHRSWRETGADGKIKLSFSPKTYKVNRLRNALVCSVGALSMGEFGVEKGLELLHHKTTTQDGLLGMLAMFGSAAVAGVFAVNFWRAYLRWRQGRVTMDDVSAEIEWMLEHSGRSKPEPSLNLKEEYFEHKSNIVRAEWSWALRKHGLLKELKLRPVSAYVLGLGGLLFAVAVVALAAWVLYGTTGMWVVLAIFIVAIVLGIIAWIVGDDDDLPPRPPASKPVPTPGQALPLPKTRPRTTPRVQKQ